jgi:dTDP-glucose 4,6-dehydratase
VGQTVNIGSNAEISVGDTLEMIREIMGREVEFLQDPERLRPAGSEVFRLWADNSLMRELTGWSPKVGLREGLSRTVDWFTDPANLSRYKADVYNV